jgi:hypothetical protein
MLKLLTKKRARKAVWRLTFPLLLALFLVFLSPVTASAQNLADYFQLSYDPVTFDKSNIQGSEVFHAIVSGRATCTQNLPLSISEASLKSQVVAVHTASGTSVTLNPSYTITVKPFPAKAGETAEISQSVPLQFPATAQPGDYTIIGKILEAKVKVGILPAMDVAGYLPQEQPMGVVKYTASTQTPAQPPTTAPTPTPPPTPATPIQPTPSGSSVPPPVPSTSPPPTTVMPWWVWFLLVVAVITIIFNIVWFLRRR